MELEYYYCSSCSFGDTDVFVAYSRAVANGELYKCPACGEENFVDTEWFEED